MAIDKMRRLIRIVNMLRYVPDVYWSTKLVDAGYDPRKVQFKTRSGQVFLKDFGFSLTKDKQLFFLESADGLALELKKRAGARFSVDENSELMIDLCGLRMYVQTREELYILNEVFVKCIYSFVPSYPVVVWDIGMNVAFASLYFAMQDNVVAVIGHEPFTKTFDQAMCNLSLNPHVSKKIHPFNQGISDANYHTEVDYISEWKGGVGITDGVQGIVEDLRGLSLSREMVEIRDATVICDSISSSYPGTEVILKMDCEGSEYEILKSLSSSGRLRSIRAVMIEWHRKGPEKIVSYLQRDGFSVFSLFPSGSGTGFVYAAR